MSVNVVSIHDIHGTVKEFVERSLAETPNAVAAVVAFRTRDGKWCIAFHNVLPADLAMAALLIQDQALDLFREP